MYTCMGKDVSNRRRNAFGMNEAMAEADRRFALLYDCNVCVSMEEHVNEHMAHSEYYKGLLAAEDRRLAKGCGDPEHARREDARRAKKRT